MKIKWVRTFLIWTSAQIHASVSPLSCSFCSDAGLGLRYFSPCWEAEKHQCLGTRGILQRRVREPSVVMLWGGCSGKAKPRTFCCRLCPEGVQCRIRFGLRALTLQHHASVQWEGKWGWPGFGQETSTYGLRAAGLCFRWRGQRCWSFYFLISSAQRWSVILSTNHTDKKLLSCPQLLQRKHPSVVFVHLSNLESVKYLSSQEHLVFCSNECSDCSQHGLNLLLVKWFNLRTNYRASCIFTSYSKRQTTNAHVRNGVRSHLTVPGVLQDAVPRLLDPCADDGLYGFMLFIWEQRNTFTVICSHCWWLTSPSCAH